jgi:23S rRNA pseudouridine955/2504/2580 synthase
VILDRQALHAYRIKLTHPATGESIEFIAPVAKDIEAVLAELRDLPKLK